MRQPSVIDHVISEFDRALRTLSPGASSASKPSPAVSSNPLPPPLDEAARAHASGLMRVNHSGEVCAQALYRGQALSARRGQVRDAMHRAADDEIDHLAWCEQRLGELDGRTSVLNPLWYGLSFSLGAITGIAGDKVSLGFVAATEHQVSQHLESHLASLPKNDLRSRAVVEQMLVDEQRHAQHALDAGGFVFPAPLKKAMTLVSRIMTRLSYRI